jgi:hypothetical protein
MNIGAAMRPKPGEVECGDSYVIGWRDDGVVLAVIDGLGHGRDAAEASRTACAYIEHHQDDTLSSIMQGLHRAMTHTRGAAVTLMRIRPELGEMSHSGVGNVEVSGLCQEAVRPMCVPGVVGYSLRRVVERSFPIRAGDILVAHTDGVSRQFDIEQYRHLEAQALADAILADWAKDHDDATCVSVCC